MTMMEMWKKDALETAARRSFSTVEIEYDDDGEWKVNWLAIGAATVEEAERHIDELKIACKIVGDLNLEHAALDYGYPTVGRAEFMALVYKACEMIEKGRTSRLINLVLHDGAEF